MEWCGYVEVVCLVDECEVVDDYEFDGEVDCCDGVGCVGEVCYLGVNG